MDRRNFIGLCCGGFGLTSLFSLLKPRNALVRGLPVQSLAESAPVEWSMLEDGERDIYKFKKGPDYTTLEEAFPHMEKIVEGFNHCCLDRLRLSDRVVTLESITYYPSIDNTTKKVLTI